MGSSLLIAGLEMLGDVTNPEYRLGRGSDFGQGDPDQATIESLYLDGETVQGDRSRNRQMHLPLTILNVNGKSLAVNVDTLLQQVCQDTFEVQWTPSGGLPVIFDAYKATRSRPRDLLRDLQGVTELDLTFPALPFGRSPSVMTIAAAATSTQLDNFDAARTGATLDTGIKFEGSGSNKVTLTGVANTNGGKAWVSGGTPLSRSLTPVNLTGINALSFRWRWPAPGAAATMTGTLVLTSVGGGSATITRSKDFVNGDTNWRLVNFPLTGNLGTLDITQVNGYSLTFSSTLIYGGGSSSSIWVDDLREQPSSSAQTTTTHGAQLLLPTTVGSARAPANLALSTGGTFGQFLLHSPPADQDPDAGILLALNSTLASQTVTIAAANAVLRGTFSIVLGGATDGTAGTVQVTVTQKENGTQVGVPWVSPQVTHDITTQGLLCPVGEVTLTLPLYDTPGDNTATSYDVNVNISAGTDRYSEVMLCDTAGQTILTDTAAASTGSVVYVDEPAPLQSGPPVFISGSDRTAAWGKLGDCVTSGGPMLLEPGTNKFLAWTDSGTPAVAATYFPRWLDERVV